MTKNPNEISLGYLNPFHTSGMKWVKAIFIFIQKLSNCPVIAAIADQERLCNRGFVFRIIRESIHTQQRRQDKGG